MTRWVLPIFWAVFSLSNAWGWGQYGHQQVNRAAMEIANAENNPIGKCFMNAEYIITRYAITPDVEWKKDINLKTLSPADKAQRYKDDSCEHPLHFFEGDAFFTTYKEGVISNLPSTEYNDQQHQCYQTYFDVLTKNIDFVNKVDPSKAVNDRAVSAKDVIGHGTAPWRALQLYKLGVNELKQYKQDKNNDHLNLAIFYLGTLGHYVGDMAQPFHATLNFDGTYYPDNDQKAHPHDGIHHEIDTGLLPRPDKDKNDVYSGFEDTDADVQQFGKTYLSELVGSKQKDAVMAPNEIVKTILDMVDGGYPLIDKLLSIYSEECLNPKAKDPQQAKNEKDIKKTGKMRTVATTKKSSPNITNTGSINICPPSDSNAADVVPEKHRHRISHCYSTTPAEDHGAMPDMREANPEQERNASEKETAAGGASHPFCIDYSNKGKQAVHPIGKATEADFNKQIIGFPKAQSTVFEGLEMRLGQAAAVLARLWMSAYNEAGSPEFDLGACRELGGGQESFNQSYAIQNYYAPVYYPDGANDSCKNNFASQFQGRASAATKAQ